MTPANMRCMNLHGLLVLAISPSEIPDIIFLRIPGIARG